MPEAPKNSPASASASTAAEDFLRAIVKFLRGKALYPENHPQLKEAVSGLHATLQNLLATRGQRTFVFIEDQAFMDDRLLSDSDALKEIIKPLNEKGIEVLILRQGLPLDELLAFLNLLSGSSAEKPVFRSPYIELGDLSLVGWEGQTAAPAQQMGPAVLQESDRQSAFFDEVKRLQDVYLDWNTAKEALVQNMDRIVIKLEKALFENFHSFIPLGELKSYDEYTYVHTINLAILTMAQAESLGFSKKAVHEMGIGALLHDVGKTQVSLDVLHKQGKLTAEEFEEMKSHTVKGAALLLQHPGIPHVATIVAYEHHLKYDGNGYPAMKQKRLPHIASRITSLSDQFDAMRSNRPYREALPADKILEIMNQNKGTDLDPGLLDHFIALIKSRKMV